MDAALAQVHLAIATRQLASMRMSENDEQEATSLADVAGLVVQHTHDVLDITDLCSLLQVSASCRQVLQQSRSSCSVTLCLQELSPQQKAKLQGFAAWLPKHAGLISEMKWEGPEQHQTTPEQREELQLLQQVLASALQVCRKAAATTEAARPPAAAVKAEHVAAGVKPLPLQLAAASFCHSWPEPQLLQELSAAGLQVLEVHSVDQEPPYMPTSSPQNTCPPHTCPTTHVPPSDFATQLAALSSRLVCLDFVPQVVHSGAFMEAVKHLTALTSLTLGVLQPETICQLPPSLQKLHAIFAAGSSGSGGSCTTVVDLRHLTALRQLRWRSHDESTSLIGDSTAAATVKGLEVWLPHNLTTLYMWLRGGSISKVTGASSLQEARLLHLKDTDVNALRHVCASTGLRSLELRTSRFSTPAASEAAAAALGSATALTRLLLKDMACAGDCKLCGQLAKLRRLADLEIRQCTLGDDTQDMLGLKTLITSLTRLQTV